MNPQDKNYLRRTPKAISAIFVLLAISLQISLALYWTEVLQPKLRTEAAADAKLIAESQGLQLLSALQAYEEMQNSDEIERTISSLMLYQEPNLGEPFFKQISLETDKELFPNLPPLVRGDSQCASCFDVEVPLYSPDTFAIMGIAHFKVSDEFFRLLARDIRNQLMIQGAIALLLLLIAWVTSLYLFRTLKKEIELRKASEIALTENQRKYHRLVSNLNQYFVYARETDGTISWISEGATQLYGYAESELRDICGLLTENPINQVAKRYLKQVNKDLEQAEFEGEIQDNKGNKRWILFSEVNLFDQSGELKSVEGLARDITRQKQIEADLIEAKEKAEVASQAKGQFLANMSHEIRTPMNAIIGNTYLIQKTQLDGKQQQYINRIDSSAHVLLGLVNDVLDISKIEAGKMELESIPFTIDELLNNLANVVISQAQQKALDILFDVPVDIPQPVLGDPLRLGQVMLNLVNNAIKFTEQGEIIVKVAVLGRSEQDLHLQFSVKDDGIGIDEEKQKLLFQSFNQADNSVTRRFGGTGLGLAICQHLVTMMKGNIRVESEYGKGSTFYFDVHLALNSKSETLTITPPELPGLKKVLIVDDSEASAVITQNILDKLGIETAIAHSAGHLLKIVQQQAQVSQYQAIIIDHFMPEVDGLEAAEMLMKSGKTDLPKLVLMTSPGAEEKHQENINQLFHEVLYKPLNREDCKDTLSRLFNHVEDEHEVHYAGGKSSLPDFSAKQILLVEDNKINQEVALALLQDINATTTIANNGQEAIAKAKQQAFDLILMDIQMPVMDGLTAAQKLRQELQVTMPIIAMTAHALEEDREKSRQAGMNDYITKPIDVTIFYDTLKRWLPANSLTKSKPASPVAAATSLPVVDGINITTLYRRIGQKDSLLDEILQEFEQSCAQFQQQIVHATEQQDNRKIGQLIHRMKGESGNVAAEALHSKIVALETSFKQHSSLDQNLLSLIDEDITKLRKVLHSHLNKNQAEEETDDGKASLLTVEKLTEIQQCTDELRALLESQSLDAMDSVTALKASLNGQVNKNTLRDLHSAIHQLDYELALNYLDKICLALNLHENVQHNV